MTRGNDGRLRWDRVHHIEWLLSPTPGWTVAIRKLDDGGYGSFFWRHLPGHERELFGGGYWKQLSVAKKRARATYERCVLKGGGR